MLELPTKHGSALVLEPACCVRASGNVGERSRQGAGAPRAGQAAVHRRLAEQGRLF